MEALRRKKTLPIPPCEQPVMSTTCFDIVFCWREKKERELRNEGKISVRKKNRQKSFIIVSTFTQKKLKESASQLQNLT